MNLFEGFKKTHEEAKSKAPGNSFLRLKYYQEWAKTVTIIAKSFMNAALSVVAGIVALVSGYYEIKKLILANQKSEVPITLDTLSGGVGVESGSGGGGLGTHVASMGYGVGSLKHHKAHKKVSEKKESSTLMTSSQIRSRFLERSFTESAPRLKPVIYSQRYAISGNTWTFLISILLFVVLRVIPMFKKDSEQKS